MTMTTHRFIQLAQWADYASHEALMYRIRAGKAADIGNRNAAIYFVNRAQRCDSIRDRARTRIASEAFIPGVDDDVPL